MQTDLEKRYQFAQLVKCLPVKNYPWRYADDPYLILLSEFMLHRTQALQVLSVFNRLVSDYPTIQSFIEEDDQILREKLSSLGLMWRINGMIEAIKTIYQRFGQVPIDYELLQTIDGIGPYIAGAVTCFVSNKPYTLIDTNIVRVIGRIFGLRLEGEARRRKEMILAITKAVPENNPRDFYYGIIDFAHDICKPKQPDCNICSFNTICEYKRKVEINDHHV